MRALINHLVGGAELLSGCLSGRPPDIAFGSTNSSYSGESDLSKLTQAYKDLVRQALAVAKGPGALGSKVTTPIGEMPGSVFLAASWMDILIHCWDLAKATAQDTRLDPQVVDISYQLFVPDAMESCWAHRSFDRCAGRRQPSG